MSHKNSQRNRNTSLRTTTPKVAWWWLITAIFGMVVSACSISNQPAQLIDATPTRIIHATSAPSNTPLPSQTSQPTPTLGVLNIAPTPTLTTMTTDERIAMFEQIWQYVSDRYVYQDYRGVDWDATQVTFRARVQAVTTTNEFYDLIKEMIDLLNDDHTRFDTPQEVAVDEAFYSGTAGYAGIGIIIREVDEGLMIMRLAHNGPAEMAGLRQYDILTHVDGVAIADIFRDDAEYTRRIRGPIGSQITLDILRDAQRFTIQITRNAISSDAFPEAFTQPLPQNDIVYLTIDSFNRQNLDLLVKNALDKPGISATPRGLIIDVRENYGGSIGSMLDVMGLFTPGGIMGEQVGRDKTYTLEVPDGRVLPAYERIPIVILTSGETASAAEMFTSGMRSLRGAIVIGETTAGNTENLYPYDLDDGSTLWLAELLFRQNDGTYIDDIGVQPDMTIVADWGTFKPENDPFIIQAIATLTE